MNYFDEEAHRKLQLAAFASSLVMLVFKETNATMEGNNACMKETLDRVVAEVAQQIQEFGR